MTELSPALLAAEIHHFIRGYQQIRGLDPEFIYRIHAGSELEAALRISRLQQIAEYLKRLQEPDGPTDEELSRIYQSAYGRAWERGEFHSAHPDGLRAVLARWGK